MRKLMSLALALVMSLALAAPVAAANVDTSGSTGAVPVALTAEAATFSVTVPTSIPLNVDANAAVTCATNLNIINNSAGPVEVTGISVQNSAWSIVSFNGGNRSSLASEKVNSNKLGLALTPDGGTQVATSTTGNQNLTLPEDQWVITAGGNLPFECAGIATAVSASASNVQAAKVVFTVAWNKAPEMGTFYIDDSVMELGYPSGAFQFEIGMTFGEWATAHPEVGYIISDVSVGYESTEYGFLELGRTDEVIVNGKSYECYI